MRSRLLRLSYRYRSALVESLESRRLLSGYTLQTIASFDKSGPWFPATAMIQDGGGNLFGIAAQVGSTRHNGLFELAKGASVPTLVEQIPGTTFAVPNPITTSLVIDSHGNIFFGVSFIGDSAGDGAILELPQGVSTLTTVAKFDGAGNGSGPRGHISIDSQGNIFGTSNSGGANNGGTIWELASGSSTITALASFPAISNRADPEGLSEDANGNLFGVIGYGPSVAIAGGFGSVWELPKSSATINTVGTFTGSNGSNPQGDLFIDASENVFGVTEAGGSGFSSNAGTGDGTVFKIPAGSSSIQTVAQFNSSVGQNPVEGVAADSAGNLFGVTEGGTGGVFEVAKGSSQIVQLATLSSNGPTSGVLINSSGDLFGTTTMGGTGGGGTIFELTPGAAPSSSLTATLSGKVSSKPATPGKHFTISQTVTITNNSGSPVSGTVSGILYLSTGTTIDSTSIQIATGHVKLNKLKPHKHVSFVLKASKVPATATAGTDHLIARLTDPSHNTFDVLSSATLTVS